MSGGLGGDFLDAVAATLERIDTTPELGVPTSQDRRTRRLLLARFPFHLVYRVAPAELVVIAVAHTKRRPGYWKARR
ncbi:MAG: type II toxin-antitoxin system RelE/ParE family toxin [Myxococcales bacterium]|nr:type II toxin-antitoxin system RelE/ParE family toxin [Myxococcales bacterium]